MKATLVVMLMAFVVSAASQNGPRPRVLSPKESVYVAQNGQEQRGERVFQRNCGRCHTRPEGFSPRISETVAMHMRVRANLSQADFKALLHFLNP